ncbi:MAG: hypothetical protein MSD82_08935 [Prevotella sp.]|nr:hypothetical protein [Prevotella sp.]
MKKCYLSPSMELVRVLTESILAPISVTENGEPSPDMGIGGDSPGGMEADAKKGNINLWDD